LRRCSVKRKTGYEIETWLEFRRGPSRSQDTTYKACVGFDENRNAIQIPYLDTYGNIVGFAFRNMDEDKPKYINSKEDNVFKKSDLLFGLDKARHHISDRIYIVEGYFDVMAMW